VERTTDEHSPREDDELKREETALLRGAPEEGRSEPRRAEEPGLDEPRSARRADVENEYHGAPGVGEVEDRAALAATFPPAMFPARREELLEAATAAYADDQLLGDLRRIPDRLYDDVSRVWDELQTVRARPRMPEE
jgi:hypothetical protein